MNIESKWRDIQGSAPILGLDPQLAIRTLQTECNRKPHAILHFYWHPLPKLLSSSRPNFVAELEAHNMICVIKNTIEIRDACLFLCLHIFLILIAFYAVLFHSPKTVPDFSSERPSATHNLFFFPVNKINLAWIVVVIAPTSIEGWKNGPMWN